ncbi:MAG: hypothetical protein QGD94_00960 [Planctomycetia bacterium]|nr:hypothetical protein [Planctomycetia bacterium]
MGEQLYLGLLLILAAAIAGCADLSPAHAGAAGEGGRSSRIGGDIIQMKFDNGHRLLFSKKQARMVGWLDRRGTNLLAKPALKPPLELLDDYLKPMTGPDFGNPRFTSISETGGVTTVVWEIPAGTRKADGDKKKAVVLGTVRVEETFRPISRELLGTRYSGFSRRISLTVPPQLRVRTIRINEAYGVGGVLEGHTSYELRHPWPEVIRWSKKTEKARKENIIGFVMGTNDRLGRFMGGSRQPFLFIDHGKGNFLIYPERMDIHWLAYLSSYHIEGAEGIWPNFEATVGSKTGRFSIGEINYLFAESGDRLPPQRWLDAKATLAAEFRKKLGLKANRVHAHNFHIVPDYLRSNRFKSGKDMADHFAPILAAANVDSVFIDSWQFIRPKNWKGPRDAWGCCQIDTLETADDFGGDEALKYMCDKFRKHGIDVLLWLNPQWVAARGTSQEDGKEGSAMIRLHPEFVVRNPDGTPNTWKGFYALSWAHGYGDYLLKVTKHLRDNVGIKGYMLDASASFINHVDYRPDGAELMLPHYWKLIRGWQALGIELLSEEPTGILNYGNIGYVKHKEWFSFGETVSRTENLPRRIYELIHSNGAGLFTHTVNDNLGAANDYFRKFRSVHGEIPDRIELVNLRRDVGAKRWLYDNTVWVYGTRRVPYRIVAKRRPVAVPSAEGASASRALRRLKAGKSLALKGEKQLSLVCEFKVRAAARDIRRITVQAASTADTETTKQISLWNWKNKKWGRAVKARIASDETWLQADRYEPGDSYVGTGGIVRARIEWQTTGRVNLHHLSLLEVVDNLKPSAGSTP